MFPFIEMGKVRLREIKLPKITQLEVNYPRIVRLYSLYVESPMSAGVQSEK